jgi:two-component system phosphate regulon sensor histidine kinase PhoR
MAGEERHRSRPIALALLAGLPAGLVLAGLVALGRLGVAEALLAFAIACAVGLVLAHRHAANIGLLGRWVAEGDRSPPAFASEPFRPALAELARRVGDAVGRSESERDALKADAQRLLDALPDTLLFLGRDGRILRANRAARTTFGEGILGRELATVLRQPALLDAVAAALAAGTRSDVALHEAGTPERHFAGHVEPLPVAAAGGPALLVVLADRTAAHRAERMRVDFVANASHEIRSPLATLVGFIETLRGPAREDADARERFLGIMADQAGRMTRLVQDLLSLSRIEMNEHTAPAGRVDLAGVAERVVAALAWEAGQRGMTLAVEAEPGLPWVRGDEAELEQVCHNLIGNAIKYGAPGTPVAVSIARASRPPPEVRWTGGEAVALAVRDRGPGIPREHIPRLTERFYRVDPARSRQLGGTGLGLAIVKHIVNRHRGALAIESTLGEGSTFTVYLPEA